MHIERRINSKTDSIELWEVEWEYEDGLPAHKTFVRLIGVEQPIQPLGDDSWSKASAICWASDRTLGNIAVFSPSILGSFPGRRGDDAILPCDLVNAGKFRHGKERWWCRTHQSHWGTKADLKAAKEGGTVHCSSHLQPMNYVVDPLELDIATYGEVGVWCSMPAALSSSPIASRPPRIHLHLRDGAGDKIKQVDRDFGAISLLYQQELDLFSSQEITRINITPPAALEFVLAIEQGREMDCISCNYCGFPHLDLGDFARKPHRKHFCGNCGRDSIWSKEAIVSTPLKPLYDQLSKSKKFFVPDRFLNLDDFEGCNYSAWASTAAVLWTADRSQEKGIHVHIDRDGERIVDETFGTVVFEGAELDRQELLERMISALN